MIETDIRKLAGRDYHIVNQFGLGAIAGLRSQNHICGAIARFPSLTVIFGILDFGIRND